MRLRAIVPAVAGVGLLAITSFAGTAPAASACLIVENTATYWVAGRIEVSVRVPGDRRLPRIF